MKIAQTIAVVTGGASGLGEACVRRIVESGGRAVILDLDGARGEALAREIGEQAIFVETNVTSEASVLAALDKAVSVFGTVTATINCAGVAVVIKTIGKDGPHPFDTYQKVLAINLAGSFNVARLCAAKMANNAPNADGERGVIVNLASVAAFDGQKGQAAYASSKGGIVGMTLPMARDLAAQGIRVNTVAPGLFLTPMMAGLPEAAQQALSQQPLMPQRLGRPEELAHLVCFMIECAYINGETVRLDGGVRLP